MQITCRLFPRAQHGLCQSSYFMPFSRVRVDLKQNYKYSFLQLKRIISWEISNFIYPVKQHWNWGHLKKNLQCCIGIANSCIWFLYSDKDTSCTKHHEYTMRRGGWKVESSDIKNKYELHKLLDKLPLESIVIVQNYLW